MFLDLTCKEALYGGALGGGKSDALLMCASQYVHVPGHHTILFRLTRPNCQDLIDRSHAWWGDHGRWNGSTRGGRWTFPSGAMIEFGYMQHRADVYNYKGPEYQQILFDELTEFDEFQYTYMWTRLRKKTCTRHQATGYVPECPVCVVAKALQNVPLRVRGATNPDGPGRGWVKARFVSEEAEAEIDAGNARDVYHKGKAAFVPSRVEENPGVNVQEYVEESIGHLSPALRQQLHKGSWSVVEGAILKQEWLRYYEMQGDLFIPCDASNNPTPARIDMRTCHRFATLDTASTGTEEMKRQKSGKQPSWSVIAVWDWTGHRQGGYLMLRHIWRDRVNWIDLKTTVPEVLRDWSVKTTIIEKANSGVQLIQELTKMGGFNVKSFLPHSRKDFKNEGGRPGKLDRSTRFQNMLEQGRVFLPKFENSGWRRALEDEWVTWTGHEDDPADQVDVASIAAIECEHLGAGRFPTPMDRGVDSVMYRGHQPTAKTWNPGR